MSSQPGPNEDMSEENLPGERSHAHEGTVERPHGDPFADPGLPPHEPRRQDIDERTAKRSERVVAFLFTLSMVATVGFIASYVALPIKKIIYVFPFGRVVPDLVSWSRRASPCSASARARSTGPAP